jgi:hypothetical protein
LFIKFMRERFDIYDVTGRKYAIKISNSILTAGLQKNMKPYRIRMGLSRHFDDLAVFAENDNRLGFSLDFGVNLKITDKIKYFVDGEYEFERLKITSYVDSYISRHRKYLSGKKFNTGGISVNTGFSF